MSESEDVTGLRGADQCMPRGTGHGPDDLIAFVCGLRIALFIVKKGRGRAEMGEGWLVGRSAEENAGW
jgi:hypothetical protein